MLYVFYRHRNDPTRELVMHDGAAFPNHLRQRDWYLHGIHTSVMGGRTEADIGTLGYCERKGGVTFGRKLVVRHRPDIDRNVMRSDKAATGTSMNVEPRRVEEWG